MKRQALHMQGDRDQSPSDPAATVVRAVRLGTVLDLRYEIVAELARGGFAVAYLARDLRLNTRAVVKVLLPEAAANPWVAKKFRQEAEALGRIDHPGVVGLRDIGTCADGTPYLVIQYVEGETLRAAMQSGPFDLARVAALMRQAGRAVGAAHQKGVLHLDLTPGNIMLRRLDDGEELVTVIDFGIARVRDSLSGSTDVSRVLAGTLPYMAPEQLRRQPLTPATDVYALGVIAYELCTRQRPFDAESEADLIVQQGAGVTRAPRALRPDLTVEAEDAVLRALAFEPAQRFQDARAFGDALGQALAGAGPRPAPPRQEVDSAVTPRFAVRDPVTAHVVFIDLVKFSKLPTDDELRQLNELKEVVLRAEAVERTRDPGVDVIRLPTGDGAALAFFTPSPLPAVRSAIRISHGWTSAAGDARNGLRTGVHTGTVYREPDVNGAPNLVGAGINTAQRVMSVGDARHILVSRAVADVLLALRDWKPLVHELGTARVKSDTFEVFSLWGEWRDEVASGAVHIGNPARPRQLARRILSIGNIAAAAVLFAVALLASWQSGLLSNGEGPPPPTSTTSVDTPIATTNPMPATTTTTTTTRATIDPQRALRQTLDRRDRAYAAGNYIDAVAACRDAAALDPRGASKQSCDDLYEQGQTIGRRTRRAEQLRAAGDLDAALREVEGALRLNASDPAASQLRQQINDTINAERRRVKSPGA